MSNAGPSAAATLLLAVVVGAAFGGMRPVVLLAVVVSLLAGYFSLRRPDWREPSDKRLPALIIAAAAFTGSQFLGGSGLLLLTPVVAAVSVVATLPQHNHVTRTARVALPLIFGALAAWALRQHEPRIDVEVFLRESVHALFTGHNPFAITFPNIYGPEATDFYYGPGVVQHGRVMSGFPYPPLVLLTAVPGYLLGDVRLSSVIAVCGAGAFLLARSNSTGSRRAAVLLICLPGIASIFANAWVEPIIVALLAVVVLASKRGHWMTAAVAVGLLFVSKQYFVVAAPCLWLLRPYATRGRILAALAAGGGVTLPFIAWNPAAWWHSVVQLQFHQPFRPDSMSLIAELAGLFSRPGPTWAGPVSLIVGFAAAVLFAKTLRPGTSEFTLALGLTLAVTFLLSKQAFMNYYLVSAAALLLASWSRAVDSAAATPSTLAQATVESGPRQSPDIRYAARSR